MTTESMHSVCRTSAPPHICGFLDDPPKSSEKDKRVNANSLLSPAHLPARCHTYTSLTSLLAGLSFFRGESFSGAGNADECCNLCRNNTRVCVRYIVPPPAAARAAFCMSHAMLRHQAHADRWYPALLQCNVFNYCSHGAGCDAAGDCDYFVSQQPRDPPVCPKASAC